MVVQELLSAKNSKVVTVRPSTTLVEAAQALTTHRIGALVVTDDAGRFEIDNVPLGTVRFQAIVPDEGIAILLAATEYCIVCTSNSNLYRWICESEPA